MKTVNIYCTNADFNLQYMVFVSHMGKSYLAQKVRLKKIPQLQFTLQLSAVIPLIITFTGFLFDTMLLKKVISYFSTNMGQKRVLLR